MSAPSRLAVVASHPIQYHAPLYRRLAAHPEIDLHVYFGSRWGVDDYVDPGFGAKVRWDIPLLEGYAHTFLPSAVRRPGPDRFLGILNPSIVREVARGGYDAVLLQGWALASNWLAWGTAAARRVPVLLAGESNGLREPTGAKAAAKRLVLRTFFSGVDAFLAIGTLNRGYYLARGIPESRLFHFPYAVDNDFFTARADALAPRRVELKRAEGLDEDRPVLLFCGKYVPKKRPLDLLDAYVASGAHESASLVFVGEGPLRGEMERRIARHGLRHVRLTGFRNQTELPRAYAMADAFALPSDHEPWGLVVNEAMCFGLPVVASDHVGAAPDLVEPGKNGFVHRAGDVKALGDALVALAGDEDLRRRMGAASRALVAGWSYAEDVEGVAAALRSVRR